MRHPIEFTGTYHTSWNGYYFKEPLGYTSGVHTGVDYNGAGAGNSDLGLSIVAITSGKVVGRINNGAISGFGNALIIESNCPPTVKGNKLYHRYLHMNSVSVSNGQSVAEGQVIGTVGNTGTKWAHLHLDTWTDRNGLGPHWNYDKNTSLASYEDPYHLIKNNQSWTGVTPPTGGNMAGISDDVSRQIGFHFLGRNGQDGKPNALQSKQNDIAGKELTNAQMSTFFLSAESRDWRDNRLPKVYAERNALRETNQNLTTVNTQLTKANAELTKTNQKQGQVILEQQGVINGQKLEINELVDENAKLRKQLEDCGTKPDPDSVVITKDSLWTVFTNWINKISGRGK